MATELAGEEEGVPERFAPGEMRGQMIEAEHLGRYRWASSIAANRRILDAGCGTAYGAAMLARRGAQEVVGIDIAEEVLESVRDEMPAGVRLEAGDLTDLSRFKPGAFDLVVCFEVIEHFEDPSPVLDELVRVLAPDGVLLISSPNRMVYPPGNPHHHHEFLPAELAAELRARVRNVRLARQHAYVTAAVLDEEHLEASVEKPLEGVPFYKLLAEDLDEEIYTLAIAGDGELPEMPSVAMLTSHLALREWNDHTERQERQLEDQRQYIDGLASKLGDREELQSRLIEAERLIQESEMHVERLERERQALERERHDTLTSLSWRITQPLRNVKQLAAKRSR